MRPVPSDAREAADSAVHPDEVLRLARALVSTPSENPGGLEEDAAAVAGGLLEELGATVQVVRSDTGRPNLVAGFGKGAGPALAWNGHLDVVPVGDVSTWTSPPWDAGISGGRLIGRGAADMKGPIASALAAVAALRRAGIELGGRLVFHLVSDEERAGMHGTKVLWERGMLDQDAAIVGEPSELQVGLAERGGAWLGLIAHGRSAHGSRPDLGVNAITAMARFLLRIEEVLPDRSHPLVGRPSVNASMITGGSAPNMVPDRCEVEIDRRTVPGESSPDEVRAPFDALAAAIRAEHPEVDIEITLRQWTESAEAAADSRIADEVREATTRVRGATPTDAGFTGITDARFYVNEASIPTVIFGPGSLSVAHAPDEWVLVDDLVDAARIYARIFVGFLGAG
jgi:acetylornithine deacetylase/succinyl-diaminopimelate desuccinylase